MKKISWKSAPMGRLVAAACATCMILFTMSATVAHAQLLNFDDLNGNTEQGVPSGYGNLQWENLYALNTQTYDLNPSGYRAGTVSPPNVLYNGGGESAEVYVNSGSFTPVYAYMTAAWNDNLQVEVTGYLRGKKVFDHTYTLSALKPTICVFAVTVDTLDFNSFGGTHHAGYPGNGEHFAMDNFLVAK
jgi:hypothetical protein